MKISALVHGVIDYVTVLFLFIAPAMVGMQREASMFTCVLAGIHLLLTVITDFKVGIFKIVSFKIHGFIEIAVSVLLLCIAVWFKSSGDKIAFYFYLVFSIVLFIVWMFSDYQQSKR